MSNLNNKFKEKEVKDILKKTNALETKYKNITHSQSKKKIRIHPGSDIRRI